ncbi:MAG: UpxY family transcription antiterminator, partial [Chitinophagaceae bacterium]
AFKKGWYVIYTKSRHEKRVTHKLAELEIIFFLPITKQLRKWSDRKKYIDLPLFPSYIFVYLDDMNDYYNSLSIPGVLCYVRFGGEIACVSEAVINNLKLLAGKELEIEIGSEYFQPGQQVVIRQGILTGLSCEFVRYNNKEKFLVRVNLLQRNILVTIPSGHLMPVLS